ncbi:hypothetical protein IM697_19515 [Streptomyces ferrugineus]|uniref:Uncharacterized protein n=1 Tax=Streptomyces ferrugineus TaxID=1413221 RepID=A0A7M2SWX0_9ACTN|nr:hypothetical protein [Streptomyces ferrugineus]QOV40399.1 hypothetical protein IM697_19515 [Streptomyces ferrugineus]
MPPTKAFLFLTFLGGNHTSYWSEGRCADCRAVRRTAPLDCSPLEGRIIPVSGATA